MGSSPGRRDSIWSTLALTHGEILRVIFSGLNMSFVWTGSSRMGSMRVIQFGDRYPVRNDNRVTGRRERGGRVIAVGVIYL